MALGNYRFNPSTIIGPLSLYIYICVCVCVRAGMRVCIYICVCMCVFMKMYRDEKTHGLQRMILFIELFANVKRFGFWPSFWS